MTAPQTPQPPPDPPHVMSRAAWKRLARERYEQQADEAEQESKQQ